MTENIRLFPRLYTKPLDAIGGFMDSGGILYGVAAVLVVSFLPQMSLASPLPEIRPPDPHSPGLPGHPHLDAKQYPHSRDEPAMFVEHRPFDPEGLYYYGQALGALGEAEKARDAFQRAIDAVRTAPTYRRGPLRRSRPAQKERRRLPRESRA